MRLLIASALFLTTMVTGAFAQQPTAKYDTVVANGRVVDPESGLDAVRNVGIRAGKIVAITESPLQARTTIDAKGLVVTAGFIDLHDHGQDDENYRYKAMDGVTTALELEIGTADLNKWYADREHRALVNYGATVGATPIRMQVMHDSSKGLVPRDAAISTVATADQIQQMSQKVRAGLDQGALGVGYGLQYTPAASRLEVLEMFRVASEYHAPVFIHVRGMGPRDTNGGVDGVQEAIADAEISGAPVHIVHISSTGLSVAPQLLKMVAGARHNGLDVTTECYPYDAAMTDISSALFAGDWQKMFGISYDGLQWTGTGERLTKATFEKYRKQGGMVIIHAIPPAAAQAAIVSPLTMIASDGEMENGKGHPRGAGSYARMLGKYVRDDRALPLNEALRKMSLMPAQRLEVRDPAMKNKGRVRVGADADLTIFDAGKVKDEATYEHPNRYSSGIEYVLVNGTLVVKNGALVQDIFPGKAVRVPNSEAGRKPRNVAVLNR
jgi:N-acyl-D-aspartate/D-glutamate deacylase